MHRYPEVMILKKQSMKDLAKIRSYLLSISLKGSTNLFLKYPKSLLSDIMQLVEYNWNTITTKK